MKEVKIYPRCESDEIELVWYTVEEYEYSVSYPAYKHCLRCDLEFARYIDEYEFEDEINKEIN